MDTLPHVPPSPDRVQAMTQHLLRLIGKEFATDSVAEILNGLFTVMRGLISVTLDKQNDEHNRAELRR